MVQEDIWHGSDTHPHTTDNIKMMKDALIDGREVKFKEGETVVTVKQGPESHKRTAPFGVLLSVIPSSGQQNTTSKKINREKWIYLVKSGENHGTYASFHMYQVCEETQQPITDAVAVVPPSRMAQWSFKLGNMGMQTLSYGGGVMALQSVWWLTRHSRWIRHPILIPIVLAGITVTLLTPSMIAEFVMKVMTVGGGYIMQVVTKISTAWLGDPWFWFLPCAITVICMIVWCTKGNGFANGQVIVLEKQIIPPPEQVKEKDKIQKPMDGCDVPGKTTVTPVQPPQDTVPVKADAPTITPRQPETNKCQAGSLLKLGNVNQKLSPTPCVQPAVFILPLAEGDVLSGIQSETQPPSFAVCVDHWKTYNAYRMEVTCHIIGCNELGTPFTTKEGTIYECNQHTKNRVLEGQGIRGGIHPRGWKKMKEDPDSPEMPHLEAMTPRTLGMGNDSSLSNTTISTASNKEDLEKRLKEMGGRHMETPRLKEAPVQKGETRQEPITPTHMGDRNQCSGKEDHMSNTTTRKRSPKYRRDQSDSSANHSMDDSESDTVSDSESGKNRRTRRRKRGKENRKRMSSQSSHSSTESLLPQGLCHAKYKRPRTVVRHVEREPTPRKGRDKYDAICDRLGAMADQEEKKAGGLGKVDQFMVCALRGFGCYEIDLCTGIYGKDLEDAIRRQGRTDREHLWHQKLKIPLTNRIAKAASTGRFGNVKGDGTDEVSITLADCFALDSQKYRAYKWDGEKLESPNKEPHTMSCFISSAKQQITLFCMLYGWEHKKERKDALKRYERLHERKPDLFTVAFLVECWNRTWFEYTECIREGVRTLIRMSPEGTSRDAFIRLALSPHRKTGTRVWRWPNVFSFTSSSGAWKGRILPEIEEQLEAARINGSALLRHTPTTGDHPGAGGEQPKGLSKKEKAALRKNGRTLTGGTKNPETGGKVEHEETGKTGGNTELKTSPLLGKRMRTQEYEASRIHAPRDGPTGKPLCWNFNSNLGCATRGKECEHGLHRMMKRGGVHWTITAQLARRGGFKGSPIAPAAVDGYIQSLRDANTLATQGKIGDGHTGGYQKETAECDIGPLITHPPGLEKEIPNGAKPVLPESMIPKESPSMHPINPGVGIYPADIDQFDFTLNEDNCRDLLYGRDSWLVPQDETYGLVEVDTDEVFDQNKVMRFAQNQMEGVPTELQTPLLNWVALGNPTSECEFEEHLATGLRNIVAHGNSKLRNQALEILGRRKNLDRFHAGDGGVCRITWGPTSPLDDCVCQTLWIGPLHFCAIDYGDVICLTESMQKRLTAVDKEERNQCTLLAVAAGMVALDGKPGNVPARSRVAKLAVELRSNEWQIAHSIGESNGEAKSYNQRTLCSLSHDILHPHHDRDYRSLAIFLGPFLSRNQITLRIFDVLRSGSGETVLQIIVIGDITFGEKHGYLDILASSGHMRWLQVGIDTLPCAKRDWLKYLEDFVLVIPIGEAEQIMDDDHSNVSGCDWMNCRQCRRKEKTALASAEFYHTTKYTKKWSEAIILENSHTGGYPIAPHTIGDPVNLTFPIKQVEWRGTTQHHSMVDDFFDIGTGEYSLANLRAVAAIGDRLINHYGTLHRALRAVQEPKMIAQDNLVQNAREYLTHDPDLQEDVINLHRIGATPKYRGKEPGTFRVRGLPHNPSEQDFIMSKLWSYVNAGKMFVCNSGAIPVDDQYIVSPSTTVAKKLPDRTVSNDRRVILDVRRVNLKCPKEDYWKVQTPMLEDLARKYCRLKTSAPGIKVVGTKRDIDAAFTRCRLHPDSCTLFGTEFEVDKDRGDSVVFFYLVLPFGFTGSPGIFGRLMQAVQSFHRLHRPVNPQWNGVEGLSAEVYIDDGMFIELEMGQRPRISVEVWEKGVRLFLGPTGISQKKLEIEGQWTEELLLLGFHVNLARDRVELPNPKVTGAAVLVNSPVFNHGNRVIGIHDLQEIRGCVNHWGQTGRIWRWLAPPINQLLAKGDSNNLWVRCNDGSMWEAFWNVMDFIREIVNKEENWPKLFTGVFSEIIGITKELTMPNTSREVIWFSADATPDCIGGINWRTRQYFVENPKEYITPLLPPNRVTGHISEIEFLVEILCTMVWSFNSETLIVCGLTDNMNSNIWMTGGKAKRGVSLSLTRMFHHWLLNQRFRFFSYYIRSEHNISPDFLSRATFAEVEMWEKEHQMTRIRPLTQWLQLCNTNILDGAGIQATIATLQPIDKQVFRCVEWQAGGFSMTQAAHSLQLTCQWIDPRHSRIARLVTEMGFQEYNGDVVHLMGGMAKDLVEVQSFYNMFMCLKARQGLLITPHMLTFAKDEKTPYVAHRSVDSSILGDILANRWNLYAFGDFDLQKMMYHLQLEPPTSFKRRYRALGLECKEDSIGFAQVFKIPHCMGKEIHIVDEHGQWTFGNESLYQGMPHKCSLHTAWRWPVLVTTDNVPTIGQRLAVLGGLEGFQFAPICDDGFANDALWRLTPGSIWRHALTTATHTQRDVDIRDEQAEEENLPYTTGGGPPNHRRGRNGEHEQTVHARGRLPWRDRIHTTQMRRIQFKWPNVLTNLEIWAQTGRCLSVPLGPNGRVGVCINKEHGRYPGSSALSAHNEVDDEDFTSNFRWPEGPDGMMHRYTSGEISRVSHIPGGSNHKNLFTYKRIWYAEMLFNTGVYGFHFEPYIHEIIRRTYRRELTFEHLYAPEWFTAAIGEMLCQQEQCPEKWRQICIVRGRDRISFQENVKALTQCTDHHACEYIKWIFKGGGYRVSDWAWSDEARLGRPVWDPTATQYAADETPRTYTTGGMASEFDHRIAQLLEYEKFTLLTTGLADKTRTQYMSCWRRWAHYSACMGKTPWIKSFEHGWDETMLDYMVWQHKILGMQHSALTKGFYAIRYVHIVEGLEDIAIRAHRVRCIIKAVKLRSKTCKKLPMTTEMIIWIGHQLEVFDDANKQFKTHQLWCGIVIAFFFCLRISELLALTTTDVVVEMNEGVKHITLLIRGSKTDQEKNGVVRTLRENKSSLCPVKATERFLALRESQADTNPKLFTQNCRERITQSLKWAASNHGVTSEVINTHSLRSGGATALYLAGINWITIQRFGRWKSCIFHEYIWAESAGFSHLGEAIASVQGPNHQIENLAKLHLKRTALPMPLFHTGACNTDTESGEISSANPNFSRGINYPSNYGDHSGQEPTHAYVKGDYHIDVINPSHTTTQGRYLHPNYPGTIAIMRPLFGKSLYTFVSSTFTLHLHRLHPLVGWHCVISYNRWVYPCTSNTLWFHFQCRIYLCQGTFWWLDDFLHWFFHFGSTVTYMFWRGGPPEIWVTKFRCLSVVISMHFMDRFATTHIAEGWNLCASFPFVGGLITEGPTPLTRCHRIIFVFAAKRTVNSPLLLDQKKRMRISCLPFWFDQNSNNRPFKPLNAFWHRDTSFNVRVLIFFGVEDLPLWWWMVIHSCGKNCPWHGFNLPDHSILYRTPYYPCNLDWWSIIFKLVHPNFWVEWGYGGHFCGSVHSNALTADNTFRTCRQFFFHNGIHDIPLICRWFPRGYVVFPLSLLCVVTLVEVSYNNTSCSCSTKYDHLHHVSHLSTFLRPTLMSRHTCPISFVLKELWWSFKRYDLNRFECSVSSFQFTRLGGHTHFVHSIEMPTENRMEPFMWQGEIDLTLSDDEEESTLVLPLVPVELYNFLFPRHQIVRLQPVPTVMPGRKENVKPMRTRIQPGIVPPMRWIDYCQSNLITERLVPITICIQESQLRHTWIVPDDEPISQIRTRCGEIWDATIRLQQDQEPISGTRMVGQLVQTDASLPVIDACVLRAHGNSLLKPQEPRGGARVLIHAFNVDTQQNANFILAWHDSMRQLCDMIEYEWNACFQYWVNGVEVHTTAGSISSFYDRSLSPPLVVTYSHPLPESSPNFRRPVDITLQGRFREHRFMYAEGKNTGLKHPCCAAHRERYYYLCRGQDPIRDTPLSEFCNGDKTVPTVRQQRENETNIRNNRHVPRHDRRQREPSRPPHSRRHQARSRSRTPPRRPRNDHRGNPHPRVTRDNGNVQQHDDGRTYLGPRSNHANVHASPSPTSSSDQPPRTPNVTPKARPTPRTEPQDGKVNGIRSGPYLPRQPSLVTAPPRTATEPAQPAEPAPTTTPSVEEALRILEEAYEAERKAQEADQDDDDVSVAPPSSKAAPPRPRYGPASLNDDFEDEHDQIRRIQRNALANVARFWQTVAIPPTRQSALIDPQAFSKIETTYLSRGEDFSNLVESLGVNNATKRARQMARLRGMTPSSNRTVYLDRIRTYNSAIVRLRYQ